GGEAGWPRCYDRGKRTGCTGNMTDIAVIGAAAISGGVAICAQLVTSWTRKAEAREKRRSERQTTYLMTMDLVTDWGWESDEPGYDVERRFSLPFVRASNRVRLYGSPASVAAIDDMQRGLNLLNKAQRGDGDSAAAYKAIYAAYDKFVIAAREDVGPREDED